MNIDEYNEKLQEFANKMSIVFNSAKTDSVNSMREVANEIENFLQLLDSGNLDAAKNLFPSMSGQQLSDLAKNEEGIKKIRDEVDKLREAAEENERGFDRIQTGLQKAFDSGASIKDFRKGIDFVSDGFSDVLKMTNLFADGLRNIGQASGIEGLETVADGLSSAAGLVGSAFDGAKIGAAFGPVGAAIGGAVGLISSGAKMIAENKKHLEMLKQQVAAEEEKECFAEFDINRLYRERYDWDRVNHGRMVSAAS